LSETADVELYHSLQKLDCKEVDMGQTEKGLLHYKGKWNSSTYEYYNGKVLGLI
jgi:hypothetical protein